MAMGFSTVVAETADKVTDTFHRAMFRFGLRGGLTVTARMTIPIGKATIAIGAQVDDLALMGARPVAPPSLCIEVKNIGLEDVTVTEVGLMAGEYGPQIPMIDPLLHDNGSWPRRLKPGDTVIAHFGSGLGKHPVLAKVRRALCADGRRGSPDRSGAGAAAVSGQCPPGISASPRRSGVFVTLIIINDPPCPNRF